MEEGSHGPECGAILGRDPPGRFLVADLVAMDAGDGQELGDHLRPIRERVDAGGTVHRAPAPLQASRPALHEGAAFCVALDPDARTEGLLQDLI